MQDEKQVVYQSASSVDDSRKSVNYKSTGSRIEDHPLSVQSISSQKVDVSKVVQAVPQAAASQGGYLE